MLHAQEDYDALEKQYNEELIALGNRYRNLYNPIFTKRADIIVGRFDPATAPKAAPAADASAPAAAPAAAPAPPTVAADASVAPPPLPSTAGAPASTPEAIAEAAKKVVGVPGFWLQALKNNEVRFVVRGVHLTSHGRGSGDGRVIGTRDVI